jgi:hypothetical protein
MKRRPRAYFERRRLVRRHRLRHLAAPEAAGATEPGWVNATVLFTDTNRAGETAAWLEPDRGEPTCTGIQF